MEVVSVVMLLTIITVLLLNLNQFSEKIPISVSKLSYVNTQFKYQISLVFLSLFVLLILYLVYRENFQIYVALGDIATPARDVPILGIAENESWLGIGLSFSFFVTVITAGFVFLAFRKLVKKFKYLLPFMGWVILFSLTNSFAEEVIYRLGVIVPLAGILNPNWIFLISAVAFGLPHFRGMPNGVMGVVLAGFLGWVLAKSVFETQGLFWAWVIHLLQDIVIISAFIMSAIVASKKELE
jgi:uncharacterized protein